MKLAVIEVIGLIGVVLVISMGKVFDPLRRFLRSFTHSLNPLPWVGELISCSMCTGVWVGAIWGIVHSWSWESIVIFSGFLSLLSFFVGGMFQFVENLTFRGGETSIGSRLQEVMGPSAAVELAGARARLRRKRQVGPGNDLSEDEADALLDQETEEADRLVMPPQRGGDVPN